MPRKSQLDDHPQIETIRKDLAEYKKSLREIADEHGVHPQALYRYRKATISRKIAQAHKIATKVERRAERKAFKREVSEVQAEQNLRAEAEGGDGLIKIVEQTMQRIQKLFDACDDYLSDPDDPQRYTLAPRAEEIIVTIEEERSGRTTYEKMTLQEAIDRTGLNITQARNSSNDPRNLLLNAAKSLQGQMSLLVDFYAEARQQQQVRIQDHPQWPEMVSLWVNALREYPDACEVILDVSQQSLD